MNDKEFRYLISRLRTAQKRFYAQRKEVSPTQYRTLLAEAKTLEREVDAELKTSDEAEHAPVAVQATMDLDHEPEEAAPQVGTERFFL